MKNHKGTKVTKKTILDTDFTNYTDLNLSMQSVKSVSNIICFFGVHV